MNALNLISLVGQTVAQRYRVIQRLGGGGLGDVYLAEDLTSSDKVALKILHARLHPDYEHMKLGWWDARLAAASGSGNVVRVHQVGRNDDGRVFIAMEYVEGESLAEVIDREGPLKVGRAVHLTIQIAEALAAASRVGVSHGNLKPRNVLVARRGERVKLTDFGLGRLREAIAGDPLSGLDIGARPYVAPEQLNAGDGAGDRADVYALGAILYAMLAGTAPAVALTPGAAPASDPPDGPTALRRLRPDVPPALEQLIVQAMDPEPAHRQTGMDECLTDLRDVAAAMAATRAGSVRTDRVVEAGESRRGRWKIVLFGLADRRLPRGRVKSSPSGADPGVHPRLREASRGSFRLGAKVMLTAAVALVVVGWATWTVLGWLSGGRRDARSAATTTAALDAPPDAAARVGDGTVANADRRPADPETRRTVERRPPPAVGMVPSADEERLRQADAAAVGRGPARRRRQPDAEATWRLEAERRRQPDAEAPGQLEAERRPQPDAEAAGRAEAERRRQAEVEAAARAEAERRRQAEVEAAARAEAARRRQVEVEAAARSEAERRRQAEVEAAARAEAARRRQAEGEAARRAADERRRQAETEAARVRAEASRLQAARQAEGAPSRPERPALSTQELSRILAQAEQKLSSRGLSRVSSADRWGVTLDISPAGEAMVSGVLRDMALVNEAIRLVREVPGVVAVTADVHVADGRHVTAAQSDAARLRADVERALRARGLLRESSADRWGVVVEIDAGGDVTLVGIVRDAGMRGEAVRLVQGVPGVRQVKPDIRVAERAAGT